MSVVVTFSLCYWLFYLLSILFVRFGFCVSVLSFVTFLFWVLCFCLGFCDSVLSFFYFVLGFAIMFWVFLFCFGFCDSVLSFVILFRILRFCFRFCDSVLGFCDSVLNFAILFWVFMTLVWVLWFCFVRIGHRSFEFGDSVLFVSANVHLESFKTNCTQHKTCEKIQVFKHLRQHFTNDKSTRVRSCTNLLIEKQAACK